MKIKKKLIIINLSKNYKYEINESNCDCINISSGQIDVGKSNILDFLKIRKKYWLAPLIITIVLMGALIVFTQGSVVAPFIYSIF